MNEWKNTVNIQGYLPGMLSRNPAAYGFSIWSQRWYLCTHTLFTGRLIRTRMHAFNILPHLLLETKTLRSESPILLKFIAPTSLHTCKLLISLRFTPPLPYHQPLRMHCWKAPRETSVISIKKQQIQLSCKTTVCIDIANTRLNLFFIIYATILQCKTLPVF